MENRFSEAFGTFHHIGIATKSVDKEQLLYQTVGYTPEGPVFEDSTQGIRGQFLTGGGPRLELLENLAGSDTLTPWLDSGVKMYHFGYTVTSPLEERIEFLQARGCLLIRQPQPAVAFADKKICFFMFRNGMMIELIEKEACFE